MELIQTIEKDTRVYKDDAGKIYPATGSVLDLLFPGQMQWIDQAYLDEGQRCHEETKNILSAYLQTKRWPTAAHQYLSPRVRALVEYLKENRFVPEECEQPRSSAVYGHAGIPDTLLRRGNLSLVADWKFAEAITLRYLFQVQAYQPLFHELSPKPALLLVQIDRSASIKLEVVKPVAKHWALFLNALTVLKFRLR